MEPFSTSAFKVLICTCGGSTRARALGFKAHRSGPPTRRGVASAGPDAAGAKPGARRGGGGRAPATHPRPRETRTRGRSRPVPFRLPATA
eukprot:12650320-Prorocentrum_lima.AAC.1